jgi:hypothetical protein
LHRHTTPLKRGKRMAITLEELQIKFSAETGALKSQLSGVQNQLAGFEKSADKAQSSLGFLKKAGAALGGAMIGRKLLNIGKDAVMMANDVVESEELFAVSMGRMEARAREWSDTIGESLGLNPYDLRKNVGMLNVMFDSMGVGEEEAYEMSTSLTQLANDMASFYNMDTEEAFTKLRAGITGETEPLKRLGILVDENTIKQYAMANGISKTGKEMTQTQKLQARYGAIMQQTMKAQGDLARTMDSPTNQLRILNNQFDQAKIALGQALQPALIAVLPHVTNFATGLTRMLKGGESDPLSGTMLSLSNATLAVKSRVDMSIVEIVDKVNQLRTETETKVNEYIANTQKTRELHLNISMKPQSNVIDRMTEYLQGLNDYVDSVTAKTIEEDITVMMNAALEDGEVTEDEVNAIREELRKKIQAILDKKKTEYDTAVADIRMRLGEGQIDESQAKAEVDALTEAYNKAVAGVRTLEVNMSAELGITNWTAKTTSIEDRQNMINAIENAMRAEDALLIPAEAQVKMLFKGSSLETAVIGIYGDLTSKIRTNNEEVQKLLNGWYEGHEIDWDAVWRCRQENADAIAVITGGLTKKGAVNKLVLGLGSATPEEISNFAKGYNESFKSVADLYKKNYEEQVDFIAILPDEYIKAQGKTRKDMFDTAKSEYDTGIKHAGTAVVDAAMEGLTPQVEKLFSDTANADVFEVATLRDAIGELAKSMDAAGQDSLRLWDLESQLNALVVWLNYSAKGLVEREKGMPDWRRDEARLIPQINPWQPTGIPEPLPKLTQYYDPLRYEGGGFLPSETLVVDRPKVEFKSPVFEPSTSRDLVAQPIAVDVEIAPTDIHVDMYLDDLNLGRAQVRAQQTVVRTTGGGRGPNGPTVLVKE